MSRHERRLAERAERPRGQRRRAATSKPPRSVPSIALITIVAVVLGFGAIAAFQLLNGGDGDPSGDAAASLLVPPPTIPSTVVVDGHTAGSPDAPVLVEVYGDFQCPVCARFAREYLGRLVADFVVPGDVRLVDRTIAFLGRGDPDESEQAAVAAACAGAQDTYWPFHDLLLWNQAGENRGGFSAPRLAAMADKLTLDRASWDACIADPARLDEIRRDTADAATAGINSTPTIVVDGQRIVGMPRTYDELAAVIRARLATVVVPWVP